MTLYLEGNKNKQSVKASSNPGPVNKPHPMPFLLDKVLLARQSPSCKITIINPSTLWRQYEIERSTVKTSSQKTWVQVSVTLFLYDLRRTVLNTSDLYPQISKGVNITNYLRGLLWKSGEMRYATLGSQWGRSRALRAKFLYDNTRTPLCVFTVLTSALMVQEQWWQNCWHLSKNRGNSMKDSFIVPDRPWNLM